MDACKDTILCVDTCNIYLDNVSKSFDISSLCLDQLFHHKRAAKWPNLTDALFETQASRIETKHLTDGFLSLGAELRVYQLTVENNSRTSLPPLVPFSLSFPCCSRPRSAISLSPLDRLGVDGTRSGICTAALSVSRVAAAALRERRDWRDWTAGGRRGRRCGAVTQVQTRRDLDEGFVLGRHRIISGCPSLAATTTGSAARCGSCHHCCCHSFDIMHQRQQDREDNQCARNTNAV